MQKAKNIFKEFFILMLIVTAITLIFLIILYGYNPTTKIVPNKISYQTPENINSEIQSIADTQSSTPVTITYELDETQINNSKKDGSYNSGKQNPFAKPKVEESQDTEDSENTNENNNNNKNTTSENNNTSTKNNETRYLPSTSGK